MAWALLHKWHRRFGIVAALFVVLLAVTGICLNHTEDVGLDERYIQSKVLLDWYEIRPKNAPLAFKAGSDQVTQVGERLYLNNTEISAGVDHFVGAILLNESIILAFDGQLLVISKTGEIIEKLSDIDGVPAGMHRIGISEHDEIVIDAAHGDYRLNLEALDWQEDETIAAEWSKPVQLEQALYNKILHDYRGKGLSMERVLLDLHSGRIFGRWGNYIMDFAAILFLILAITGTWMWIKN